MSASAEKTEQGDLAFPNTKRLASQTVFDVDVAQHFGSGVAVGWLGVPLGWGVLGHQYWELYENRNAHKCRIRPDGSTTNTDFGWMNRGISFFLRHKLQPGDYRQLDYCGDSALNSAGDTLCFTLGMLLGQWSRPKLQQSRQLKNGTGGVLLILLLLGIWIAAFPVKGSAWARNITGRANLLVVCWGITISLAGWLSLHSTPSSNSSDDSHRRARDTAM